LPVNSAEDQPDSDPLDQICAAAGSGACTLRAAIMQANALSGLDTINVPAGVYQITRVGSDDTGLNGDLDVSESVTIQGAGSLATIIDGNGNVTNDRVFHIRNNPNANTVTLNGLTVRDGKPLANGIADNGGGIFARVFRLVMNDVRIENNSAARGGGLYSDNCELFINGLVVASNNATVGAGGGIWAQMTIMFAGGLASRRKHSGKQRRWFVGGQRADRNSR
jgi:CSLREA domain-containing protein